MDIKYKDIKYHDRSEPYVTDYGTYYSTYMTIDGIDYKNVTPKFVSSNNTIMSYFYSPDLSLQLSYYSNLTNYEKFLLKRNTTKGVNAIDIDWDGAIISDPKNPINTTSDLLKVIKDIKDNVIYSAEDLWEDYNAPQNS